MSRGSLSDGWLIVGRTSIQGELGELPRRDSDAADAGRYRGGRDGVHALARGRLAGDAELRPAVKEGHVPRLRHIPASRGRGPLADNRIRPRSRLAGGLLLRRRLDRAADRRLASPCHDCDRLLDPGWRHRNGDNSTKTIGANRRAQCLRCNRSPGTSRGITVTSERLPVRTILGTIRCLRACATSKGRDARQPTKIRSSRLPAGTCSAL